MLEDLFGNAPGSVVVSKKDSKRKKEAGSLKALRDQVRGHSDTSSTLHSVWSLEWRDVDRINEDYHAYYHSPGHRTPMKQALESVIFIMVMNSRAIFEEHLAQHAQALSGNLHASTFSLTCSIPLLL